MSTAPGGGLDPPGAAGGVLAVPSRAVRAADQAGAQAGARHKLRGGDQYSTVQYSTEQYSTVQSSTVME